MTRSVEISRGDVIACCHHFGEVESRFGVHRCLPGLVVLVGGERLSPDCLVLCAACRAAVKGDVERLAFARFFVWDEEAFVLEDGARGSDMSGLDLAAVCEALKVK